MTSTVLTDPSSPTTDALTSPVHLVIEERVVSPPPPEDRIGRPLGDLTKTARRLLSAGSILGRPFSLHEAAGLLSVEPMHLVPAVEESLSANLLVERGDELAIADRLVGEAVYEALPQPVRLAMHREAARVLRAEGRPAVEVARQVVRGWQRSDRVPGGLLELLREERGQLSPLLAEVVRQLVATDRANEARAVVSAAQDLARRHPESDSLRAAAAHAHGVLTGGRTALRAAVRAYESSPRELDRAAASEDAGLAEHTSGSPRAALRYLGAAERRYRAVGARVAARRTREAMAEVRERRRGVGESAAVNGWGSLTEAELRVVRVVAEGLTNKQAADRLFLSPHTVDSHLRHSFAKLGVNNRVELACAVMREGRQGPGPARPENA